MESSVPSVERYASPYMPPLASSSATPQGHTSSHTPRDTALAAHAVHRPPLPNGVGGAGTDTAQSAEGATFSERPPSPAMPALPLSAFHVRSSPAFDTPGEWGLDSSTGAGVEDLDGVGTAGQQGEGDSAAGQGDGDLDRGTQGLTQVREAALHMCVCMSVCLSVRASADERG
eukprot:1110832-Pelagomonas_calceolata.AAC.2